MVTALSTGITIIENNEDTQIWNDPDSIDLDNFIYGEHYIHLELPAASKNQSNELGFEAYPSGFQFALPLGVFKETIPVSGALLDQNTVDMLNAIQQFFVKHRKTSQPLTYIILKTATGKYWQFGDPDDTMQEFAPGYIESLSPTWDGRKQLYNITLNFQVVWG